MNIVCTLDNGYLKPCGVMLTSLCENNKDEKLHIFVVSQDLTDQSKDVLRGIVEKQYHQALSFINAADVKAMQRCDVSEENGHISKAAFLRLFTASILPQNIDKVIYLDCDLIVRRSLVDLWNTDLTNLALGAVEDESSTEFIQKGLCEHLKYDRKYNYFNSGVLLINLDYWRKTNAEDKFIKYLEEYNYQLFQNDQDVLNGVLHAEKVLLPFTYNMTDNFYRKERQIRKETWEELDSILQTAHIVHFTRSKKPWLKSCSHPMQRDFFKYVDLSPWKNERPKMNFYEKLYREVRRALKYRKISDQ
mgnify:FL=1